MIYLGADHKGFALKEKLKSWLIEWDYEYEDLGAFEYNKDDDYPDSSRAVAEKVAFRQAQGQNAKGVLICGSGIGVAIAANKIKGIMAGTAINAKQIHDSVSDEDLNILAISADYTSETEAQEIIKTFLETKFSFASRHIRRVDKIKTLEK